MLSVIEVTRRCIPPPARHVNCPCVGSRRGGTCVVPTNGRKRMETSMTAPASRRQARILFPQWQGAGDVPALRPGALALAEEFGEWKGWLVVPVAEDTPLTVQDGILGRMDLVRPPRT